MHAKILPRPHAILYHDLVKNLLRIRGQLAPCSLSVALVLSAFTVFPVSAQQMPKPEPFPEVPATQPPDSLTMQDPATFPEVKMDFPIAAGRFEPTWDSIAKNYPGDPAWLREAKFGIWVHFGPQAAGQSGDWYARKIYQPGTPAYDNHIRDFGHPSEPAIKTCCIRGIPASSTPPGWSKSIAMRARASSSSRACITITSTTGTPPISPGTP